MALELARLQAVPKPWGSHDLQPWSGIDHHDVAIGEIWLQRDDSALDPALLLKLLFTREALSIQVHPDDEAAHAMGLARGKKHYDKRDKLEERRARREVRGAMRGERQD